MINLDYVIEPSEVDAIVLKLQNDTLKSIAFDYKHMYNEIKRLNEELKSTIQHQCTP